MLKILFPTFVLLAGLILPVKAAESQAAQAQPTSEELYQACTQNRAETLPNPFTDVSPDHWAYKAVLTMHYCGAFRQAAPRRLFEPSRPTQAPAPSPVQVPLPNR